MKTDKQLLQEIYDKNLKIETFYELKENPPLSGYIAKKLINNCKRALKIISKYQTDRDFELSEHIKDMEDDLSKYNKIMITSYNLGARTDIHISICVMKYWELKNES